MAGKKIYPEGLLGKKLGMTQLFTEDGRCVPVTAIQLGPCFILEIKEKAKHGYQAVKLGFEPKKAQRVSKPELGAFSKSGAGSFYHVREIRCDAERLGWTTVGQSLKAGDLFASGELVDVSGVSIGRGFSGVVKRYKVGGQPMTRGTHEVRRHIGAVGCRKFPGRIFKNKRMPGRHGNICVTTQNLEVMAIKGDENILLVKGGIPGHKGGLVEVRKAVKTYKPQEKSKQAA